MSDDNLDNPKRKRLANDLFHGWGGLLKATIAELHKHSWVQNLLIAIPVGLVFLGAAVFMNNKQMAVIVITIGLTILLWGFAAAVCLKINAADVVQTEKKASPPSSSRVQLSPAASPKQQPLVVHTTPSISLLQTPPTLVQPISLSPADLINQAGSGYILGEISQFRGPSTFDYTSSYVLWTLYLLYVRDNHAGGLEVTCTDVPNSLVRVIFTVDAFGNEYLQKVQIDRERQLFSVSGSIDRVGSAEIWLQNGTIEPVPYDSF